MVIIIDGYNLLRQKYSIAEIDKRERERLLLLLAHYYKRKKHEIIVVFDGGQSSYPARENYEDVQIIHSGYRLSADDVIKNYIEKHASHDFLVVSNDRKLCVSLIKRATCIHPAEFMKLIQEEHQHKKKFYADAIKKTSERTDMNIDELMEQAAILPINKPTHEYKKESQKAPKLKKEERKIMKKIKKL